VCGDDGDGDGDGESDDDGDGESDGDGNGDGDGDDDGDDAYWRSPLWCSVIEFLISTQTQQQIHKQNRSTHKHNNKYINNIGVEQYNNTHTNTNKHHNNKSVLTVAPRCGAASACSF
jgi:hypothetical protein